MDRLEIFRDYADKMTGIAMRFYLEEDNKMALYLLLLGKARFKIEAFPDAGHNCHEVIYAIHRYSIRNPQVQTASILEDALNLAIKYCLSTSEFLSIMECLYTQLEAEKNNKSPFRINVARILNNMRDRIVSKEALYQDEKFMEQVQLHEKYLNQKYGHKIL